MPQYGVGSSAEELPESRRGGWREGEAMLLCCSAAAVTLQPFPDWHWWSLKGNTPVSSLPPGHCREEKQNENRDSCGLEVF